MFAVEKTTIETSFSWDMYDVRQICIRYNLYTRGNSEDYDKMLRYVQDHNPNTPIVIYTVAKDIYEHSDNKDFTIERIMNILTRIITIEHKLTELW